MSEPYVNIRAWLEDAIGATIIDITQHDQEEFDQGGEAYVALHLSTGATLTFLIPADGGFSYEPTGDSGGVDCGT